MLNAMGQRLALGAEPLERDYDPLHRRTMGLRSPSERLELARGRPIDLADVAALTDEGG